jgi:hypothetical protein
MLFGEQELDFNPDYSRGMGVEIEKACFDWGIVPSLWFRQFTHDVKLTNLQNLPPPGESSQTSNQTPVVVNNSG